MSPFFQPIDPIALGHQNSYTPLKNVALINKLMIPNFKGSSGMLVGGQQTPANHIIAQSPWGNSTGNYSYQMN